MEKERYIEIDNRLFEWFEIKCWSEQIDWEDWVRPTNLEISQVTGISLADLEEYDALQDTPMAEEVHRERMDEAFRLIDDVMACAG